jgi:hypothetical protein
MTDQEAKALEAARQAWMLSWGDKRKAMCRAYHAAMLEGQVVISREDAEVLFERMEAWVGHWGPVAATARDRLRAQLGEGK